MIPATDAPLLGAVICTTDAGVAVAVGAGVAVAVGAGVTVAVGAGVAVAVGAGVTVAVGAGFGVLAELFTVTATVATPTVPELLYPLQTSVCVPFPTLVEGQA